MLNKKIPIDEKDDQIQFSIHSPIQLGNLLQVEIGILVILLLFYWFKDMNKNPGIWTPYILIATLSTVVISFLALLLYSRSYHITIDLVERVVYRRTKYLNFHIPGGNQTILLQNAEALALIWLQPYHFASGTYTNKIRGIRSRYILNAVYPDRDYATIASFYDYRNAFVIGTRISSKISLELMDLSDRGYLEENGFIKDFPFQNKRK